MKSPLFSARVLVLTISVSSDSLHRTTTARHSRLTDLMARILMRAPTSVR